MMEDIRLQQHITQMTHKSGNILDLVFTDYQHKNSVTNFKVCLFISDLVSTVWQTSYQQFPISVSTKSFRNWKDLDIEKFCDGLNFDTRNYTMNDLETFLGDCLIKIEHGVEDNVPLRKKKFTNKDLQQWYSDRLRTQKGWFARESIWKKTWCRTSVEGFQTERLRYNGMLKAARTEYFRKEFEQHKRNMKHLSKLVT